MKKALMFAIGLMSLVAAPRLAKADIGYLCNVFLVPGATSSLGNAGYVYAAIYTGMGCTGSYLNSGYVCSTGATTSACTPFTHASDQLLAEFAALRLAETSNERVVVSVSGSIIQSLQYMAPGY